MHILLIEDEPKTGKTLKQGLEEENISVDLADDGLRGLQLALGLPYQVIVSDIILPKINGLDLCRQLRSNGNKTPLLLLSALHDTSDKVAGFEAGADDYLAKPFEFRELLLRIKALARRYQPYYTQENEILQFEDLTMNLDAKTIVRGGKKIELTPKEFDLMAYFIRNQGRVISKTELAEKVWKIDFDTGTNIIEVYVNYLRNKIDKPFTMKYIHTVFGSGYTLKKEENAD